MNTEALSQVKYDQKEMKKKTTLSKQREREIEDGYNYYIYIVIHW